MSITASGNSAYRLTSETRDQLVKYVEAKQKEIITILFRDVTELDIKKTPPAIKNFLDVYPIKVQDTNTPSESTLNKVELARALAFAISAKLLPVLGFVGVLTAYSSGAIAHHLYQRSKAAKLDSLKRCAAPVEELVFEPTNQRRYYKDALDRPLQLAEVNGVQEACRAYAIALEILDLDEKGHITCGIGEIYRNYLIFGEFDTKKKMKANEQRYFHDGGHIDRKDYDKIISLVTRIQALLSVNYEEIIESIELLAPRDPRPKKTLNLEPGNFPDEFEHCTSIPKGRPRRKVRCLMPALKGFDVKKIRRFPDYTFVSEGIWLIREREIYADVSEKKLVNRDTAEVVSKKKIRTECRQKCLNLRESYFGKEGKKREESECRRVTRESLKKMFYGSPEKELFRARQHYIVRPVTLEFPDCSLILKQILKNGENFSFEDRQKEDALEKALRRTKEEVLLSRVARNEFVYLDPAESQDPLSDDYIDQSLRTYLNKLLSKCLIDIDEEVKTWTGDSPFSSLEGQKIIDEDRKIVWGRVIKESKPSQIPQTLEKTFLEVSTQKTTEQTLKYALVLGCGTNQSVITLLENGWHVVCVDFSNAVIEAMRVHVNQQQNQSWAINGKLQFICTKIENYKPTEKFDLVLANACLSYCNPRKIGMILKKIFQNLNPGCHFFGDFLTSELTLDEHKRLVVDKGSIDWERKMGGWFMKDRRNILILLASCGFEVIRCLQCDPEKSTDDPMSYFFTAFKRKPINRDLAEEKTIGLVEETAVSSHRHPSLKLPQRTTVKRKHFPMNKRLEKDEKSLNVYKNIASSPKLIVNYPMIRTLKTHLNQVLNDCIKSIEMEGASLKRDASGALLDRSEDWVGVVKALGPTKIPQRLEKTFLKISSEITETQPKSVLVLGCGISQSVVDLLKKGSHVICVDFSATLIEAMWSYVTEQNVAMDNLKLVCAKIEDYMPDDKFDLVLANACLNYCDPKQMGPIMQHLYKNLNPGGYFLGDFLSRELIVEECWEQDMGAWYMKDRRDIQVLLAGYGFKVVRCLRAEKDSNDDPKAYYFTAFKS